MFERYLSKTVLSEVIGGYIATINCWELEHWMTISCVVPHEKKHLLHCWPNIIGTPWHLKENATAKGCGCALRVCRECFPHQVAISQWRASPSDKRVSTWPAAKNLGPVLLVASNSLKMVGYNAWTMELSGISCTAKINFCWIIVARVAESSSDTTMQETGTYSKTRLVKYPVGARNEVHVQIHSNQPSTNVVPATNV